MSLPDLIRSALEGRAGRTDTCFSCRHFCTGAARLERELPGLTALSSAAAAVRAEDGLCLRHDLIINGRRRCSAYSARPG